MKLHLHHRQKVLTTTLLLQMDQKNVLKKFKHINVENPNT
jgi:hypothetical protein